jgi:hypothetical protein
VAYCGEVRDDEPIRCYNSPLISDDEGSSDGSDEDEPALQPPSEHGKSPIKPAPPEPTGKPDEREKSDFSLDGPTVSHVIDDDEEINFSDIQHEFMHWHYRLGHLSYSKLKQLAEMGDIPYRLRHARRFRCTACMYAKATSDHGERRPR